MLIFLKPVHGKDHSPLPSPGGKTAPPVLCEGNTVPPEDPRERLWAWVMVGLLLTLSLGTGGYYFIHHQRAARAKELTASPVASAADPTVRPIVVAPRTNAVVSPAPESPSTTNVEPVAASPFAWTHVQVTGVIGTARNGFVARINRQLARVGDNIDGMTVVEISPQSVKLAHGGEERDFSIGERRE